MLKIHAFVIHARPYLNNSIIAELLSCRGRISVVARGVKKTSRRAALKPFVKLEIIVSGKKELKTLVDADIKTTFPLHGAEVYSGLYMNELIYRIIARGDGESVFNRYETTLQNLADSALELRKFEYALLSAAGYGFDLYKDADGKRITKNASYLFDLAAGLRKSGTGITGGCLALLNGEQGENGAECETQLKIFMRARINQALDNKELNSRKLLHDYLALAKKNHVHGGLINPEICGN